jgi:hypothetical protein
MSLPKYISDSQVAGDINFSGGLNTTGGPLSLQDNESPDLQNIDFNKFGSILKRKGYDVLNAEAISGDPFISGLYWFEFVSAGSFVRKAIATAGTKFYKMDDLDGTWDDATNSMTITAGTQFDFETFLNKVYMTNGVDLPLVWDGAGTSSLTTMAVPTNLTDAKYIRLYNNYLFLGNVIVDNVNHNSRIYWSNIKDAGTWTATHFIDVSKDDGQEITGLRVLTDRLVIFKTRSIYVLQFTGDSDIPFILPGGGKTNSAVGCVAPFSIQEVENGLVFLSYDGFYYFDGNNSFKISDRISSTIDGLANTNLSSARSLVQKSKNRYMCAVTSSGQTENDRVLVWDYFLNAWTIYVGLAPSAMTTFYVNGIEERPYFGDYDGFVYRMDFGENDNPLGVETAINAYYYTNWRHFGDLIDKKGVPQVVIYFQTSEAVLTFAYTYDFEQGDQYSNTFSLSGGGDVYGVALYDDAVYATEGGKIVRRDLTGRGRVIRYKFENRTIDETFQVDGIGHLVHLETNV